MEDECFKCVSLELIVQPARLKLGHDRRVAPGPETFSDREQHGFCPAGFRAFDKVEDVHGNRKVTTCLPFCVVCDRRLY